MKLIVGLGNPGPDYAKTRHNFGFMVLDAIANMLETTFCDMSRWKATTAEINVDGEKVILIKPLTYMNLSGQSVGLFASYYKVEPKDVWILADELDLPLGTVRVRDEGSSAGHNGLKSIAEALGTEQYWRFRLGIGPSGVEESTVHQQPEGAAFVLQSFTEKEQPVVDKVISMTAKLILDALSSKQLESRTHKVDVAS